MLHRIVICIITALLLSVYFQNCKAMVAIVASLFMYIAFILISAVGTILAIY